MRQSNEFFKRRTWQAQCVRGVGSLNEWTLLLRRTVSDAPNAPFVDHFRRHKDFFDRKVSATRSSQTYSIPGVMKGDILLRKVGGYKPRGSVFRGQHLVTIVVMQNA